MSVRRTWSGCKPNGVFSFQNEDGAKQNLGADKTGHFNVLGFFQDYIAILIL